MEFDLSREAKRYLIKAARESIKAVLYEQNADIPKAPEELNFSSGCFVTLHLRNRLRGCIGNFRDDQSITENVKQMAIQAAFADPRFGPVSKDEFAMCDIEISVLSPMEETDAKNVKTGRDGLYIVRGHNRGVLLPQVAVEYGWNETQFLEQTCVKAGLDTQAYKDNNTKIYSFQALVFSDGNLYKED